MTYAQRSMPTMTDVVPTTVSWNARGDGLEPFLLKWIFQDGWYVIIPPKTSTVSCTPMPIIAIDHFSRFPTGSPLALSEIFGGLIPSFASRSCRASRDWRSRSRSSMSPSSVKSSGVEWGRAEGTLYVRWTRSKNGLSWFKTAMLPAGSDTT